MPELTGDVFVVSEQDKLLALTLQPFPQEQDFQALLARHPELLSSGAGGLDLLLVRREVPIRHGEDGATGWLDHLFVDAEGVLTLVEVKRSTDSRIRREVVGQMLDYASNAASGWSVEALRSYLDETHVDAEAALANLLEEGDPDVFWDDVKTNVKAGKLRLLFVADEIPSDLRRIIEFLNRHMDPMEVLGVEIRQFVGGGIKTLVPKVVGRTEATAQVKGTRSKVKWNEESFFARMDEVATKREKDVARKLLDWARGCSYIRWGEGPTEPSFVPVELQQGVRHSVLSVYGGTERSAACINPYFQHYATKPPFDSEQRRQGLLDRFNAINGIDLPPDAINKRPRINLADLSDQSLEQLLAVFDWYLAEIRAEGRVATRPITS